MTCRRMSLRRTLHASSCLERVRAAQQRAAAQDSRQQCGCCASGCPQDLAQHWTGPFWGSAKGRTVTDVCGRGSVLGALSTPRLCCPHIHWPRPEQVLLFFPPSPSSSMYTCPPTPPHSPFLPLTSFLPLLPWFSIFLSSLSLSNTNVQSIRKSCCLHIRTISRNLPCLSTNHIITLACANTWGSDYRYSLLRSTLTTFCPPCLYSHQQLGWYV